MSRVRSRESQRLRAEEARDRVALARQRAEDAGVPQHAPALWSEANSKENEAGALLARQDYAQATEVFTIVLALYRRADGLAREVRQGLQQQSEQARQVMNDSRRSAERIGARDYAPAVWDEGEAGAAAGEAALGRDAYTDATPNFEGATAAYRQAEGLAREAIRALEAARTQAEKAREASTVARRGASETGAARVRSQTVARGRRCRGPGEQRAGWSELRGRAEAFSPMLGACMVRRRRRPALHGKQKLAASMP